MDRQTLSKALDSSPKIIRTVRQNKSPVLLKSDYALNTENYSKIGKDDINRRVKILDDNPKFIELIGSILSDKAKEKIITPNEAQNKLSAQDYIATITEVMDSNRIRVSLSYNDGVNLYQHKGDDEVAKKFKNFRVNYIKSNILERYKTYMVKDNQYYLITMINLVLMEKKELLS